MTEEHYLTEEDKEMIDWSLPKWLYKDYLQCRESITALKEYMKVMETEPDEYIKLSEVWHHLRRIAGDE